MKAYSLDLRERVIAAVDANEETHEEIAERLGVSRQWVGRMVQQRERLGTIAVQTHRCGRKPKLTPQNLVRLAELVAEKPDRTLQELKELLQVDCCIQVICTALHKLGLTYKKIGPSRGTRSPRRQSAACRLAAETVGAGIFASHLH